MKFYVTLPVLERQYLCNISALIDENLQYYNQINMDKVVEINSILQVASHCCLVNKLVAKLTYLVAKIRDYITAHLPSVLVKNQTKIPYGERHC